MERHDEESNGKQEVQLEAQLHVWYHSLGYIVPMSLKCAVELGIPDEINRRSPAAISLSDLASALHLHPSKYDPVRRLMCLLVHAGFFKQVGGEGEGEGEGECYYSSTPASKLLRSPHLLINLDPAGLASWNFMSSWFRQRPADEKSISSGETEVVPMYEAANGVSAWEHLAKDPELKKLFYEATDEDARVVAGALVSECGEVFRGVETLVDVGGGNGIMTVPIAKAFPGIACTVLDLPNVIAAAGRVGDGLDNLRFVGGSMFEEVPPADVVLLKSVLHNWKDEKCVELLKICREAVVISGKTKKKKKGKLIIIDIIVVGNQQQQQQQLGDDDDDDRHNKLSQVQLCFDLLMMNLFNGKERNEEEWKKLFMAAGFSGYRIVRSLGTLSVVEVYP